MVSKGELANNAVVKTKCRFRLLNTYILGNLIFLITLVVYLKLEKHLKKLLVLPKWV